MPSEERDDAQTEGNAPAEKDDTATENSVTLTMGPEAPLVVGVACSAGGVEACQELCRLLPSLDDVAFVLVQHMDPEHHSNMREVLDAVTALTVEETRDRTVPRGGVLYTIPADCYPVLRDGRLRLLKREATYERRNPIDLFFCSLAEHQQNQAIAIVLSGAGYDAERGARLINAMGGFVIAQDPDEAEFGGMPRQLIEAELTTHTAPLGLIPSLLAQDVRTALGLARSSREAAREDPDSKEFLSIVNLVRTRCGYDFQAYKTGTLMRRIRRRMGLNKLDSLADYLDLLRSDQGEAEALFRDMLISVTGFFREPEAFRVFESDVFPALLSGKQRGDDVRVWVPACATGEEAYSLAMLLLEQVERTGNKLKVTVFGTDVDERALEVARTGVYDETMAETVRPERLRRFFVQNGQTYRVSKELREAVVFAPQNAVSDPPFSKLDLISCRNLLIYLRPEAQRRLLSVFHFALNEGGYLFLGNSETVGPSRDLFEPVSAEWRIYRRGRPRRRKQRETATPAKDDEASSTPQIENRGPTRDSLGAIVQPMLLQEYAPAAVLVDRSHRILYFSGPTSAFLEIPAGEPTLDLVSMAREGLATKLRAGLHRAVREDSRTVVNARALIDGAQRPVRIDIRPLRAPKSLAGLLLITFERPTGDQGTIPGVDDDPGDGQPSDDNVVRELEFALKATKEDLQTTIEELETSNEELKAANEEVTSMNEELQSANEELETSKQELQSLNEELSALNRQLQGNVDELERTNDDLSNLLSSTDVATLFLDRHLRIKRFTPACRQLFSLIAGDIGRPITDISARFDAADMLEEAEQVLERLVPREREVQAEGGQWFTRRIIPYRTQDNKIDGVVVTFNQVTALKSAEDELRQQARQQAAVSRLGQRALSALDLQGIFSEAVSTVAGILSVECTALLAYDIQRHRVNVRASIGCPGLQGAIPLVEDTPTNHWTRALSNRTPILLEASDVADSGKAGEWFAAAQIRSGLGVGVHCRGEPFGVLVAYTSREVTFSHEESNFIQAVAHILSAAIDRRRFEDELSYLNTTLEQRVEERTEAVQLLRDTALAINHAQRIGDGVRRVAEYVKDYLGWPMARSFVVGQASKAGIHRESWSVQWWLDPPLEGRVEPGPQLVRSPLESTGPAAAATRSGQPEWFVVDQASNGPAPDEALRAVGIRSGIAVPIHWRDETVAVLEFMTTEMVAPEPEILDVVEQIRAQLAQLVERIRAQAMALHQEAELAHISRVASMGEMASSIAHELNQPLAAVVNYAGGISQMLQNDSADRGDMIKALEQIRKQATRASDVIQGLRDFLRREELRDERVNMNKLMEQALLLTEAKARTAEISIVKHLDPKLPDILGHRTQLEQVTINLIVNGIEAMQNGGHPYRELHMITKRTDSRHIQFSIGDTGPGVASEDLHKIFDAFFTTKDSGMGMGLSISQSIVESHGGRMWAEPNSPRGLIVGVSLPIARCGVESPED